MGAAAGPNVVEDGLILALDAGNTKSYPGSGTTWTDLIGSNNGTLVNSAGFNSANGGFLNFTGSSDYVQVSGSFTLTSATFVAWVWLGTTSQLSSGIILSRGSNVTGMQLYDQTEQVGYNWNDDINAWDWSSGLTLPHQDWCMIAVSVSPSSATAYLCQSSGITSATNTISHTSTTLDAIEIGRDSLVSGWNFNGYISVAQIYNRALTAAEIAQNYNALKGRYLN